MDQKLITVAEAARRADRSKTVIRRWIDEGFLEVAYRVPGRNGPWLLDEEKFTETWPRLIAEMESRKGGRGNRALDAWGNERVTRTQEA